MKRGGPQTGRRLRGGSGGPCPEGAGQKKERLKIARGVTNGVLKRTVSSAYLDFLFVCFK